MKVGWRSPAVEWATKDCCGGVLRGVGVGVVGVGAQINGLWGAAAGGCGAVRVSDVDACGGGGDARGGGDQTCVGSCGGGGDCCDVAVGKVVAALVKRCCRAYLLRVLKAQRLVGLMQWMVISMVGSQWLKW